MVRFARAADFCILEPDFPVHVEAQLEKAWESGLVGNDSELWSPEACSPEKLCGLLMRTGVGMEGLEAVAARLFSTTEAYRSLAEFERAFKLPVPIDRQAPSGTVCHLSPPRKRKGMPSEVSSLIFLSMLDGTVQCSCFYDPCPSTSVRMQVMEGLLGTMRQIPWGPERHAIFPWRFQQRLRFLAWVGDQLGLQPIWGEHVLPFLSVEAAQSSAEAAQLPGKAGKSERGAEYGLLPRSIRAAMGA